MTRRVIKVGCEFDASQETRPAICRRFKTGAVLNLLQWVNPEIARFTVEGEGIEVWSCRQTVFQDQTDSVVLRTR